MVGGRGGFGERWSASLGLADVSYCIWIDNEVLLYSPGTYIQYPMINHNGKKYEKECIYIIESLCCTPEINTTL